MSKHALPHDSLLALPAVEMRRMIGCKELSPLELLDACIARIEAVNPRVNAITATCFDRARVEARQAEQQVMQGKPLGLLHGLPLGVKDLEDTEGLLTTYGSPLFRHHIPRADNVLVQRLRAAGAVVAGKTNVPEFGAGANSRNVVWGAVGNPFNPNLNAGGSSGGSAAALACDMLPVCTGSDTGGSLRIPAALNGVVGMRPSPGVVPSERKKFGWTPLSVVGPMGRTVADTCLQLAASAGMHGADPLTYPLDSQQFLQPKELDLSTVRVGWIEDLGVCDVDPLVRRAFQAKVALMQGWFAKCEPVELDFLGAHTCFDVLRAESFVASMDAAYSQNPANLGPNPRANYELGAAMSLRDVARARAEQTRITQAFQHYFEHYDILLCPTTPLSPFPWTSLYADSIDGKKQENYYRWLALTYVLTLTAHPAISLPCGVDELGMPFGLQVVGRFRGDVQLLAISQALEKAFSTYQQLRRPIPNVHAIPEPFPSLKSIVTAPPLAGDMQLHASGSVSAV
ncbi:amidase [Curvibacter sp. CHRR-16]|uniref:amidase n=1 Tax=Curvibacter sp. CHRR-16 TaxID=2835872 RepID=UPI001BDA0B33|nr:amidase family protein [Curvibacter sp. CHRR-16]MBT0569765.1 amidase [Curvibacter sp. CHRR-16]